MQPCGRAPAPPRLHDSPHLPRYDQNEKKDRARVCEQERDHDLVRGRDRREPGEHNEGEERGEQRKRHGSKTKRPRDPSRGRRGGSGHQFGGGGLADAGHRLV